MRLKLAQPPLEEATIYNSNTRAAHAGWGRVGQGSISGDDLGAGLVNPHGVTLLSLSSLMLNRRRVL